MRNSVNRKTVVAALVGILAFIVVGVAGFTAAKLLSQDSSDSSISQPDTLGVSPNVHTESSTTFTDRLPDDLPSETPLFQNADLTAATITEDGDFKEYFLSFHTKSASEEVVAFYKNALDRSGWQTQSTRTTATPATIDAYHESKGLNASLSSASDGTAEQGTTFHLSISYKNPSESVTP